MKTPFFTPSRLLFRLKIGLCVRVALIALAIASPLRASTALSSSGTQAATVLSDAGTLSNGTEFDYTVSIVQTGTLHVYSTGSADTCGHLLNSSGVELTTDDDSGTASNFDLSYSVNPGTYTVRVHGYAYSATGDFNIFADFNPSGGVSGSGGKTGSAVRTITAMTTGNTVPTITTFSVSPTTVSAGGQVHVVLIASDPDDNMNAYAVRHINFGGINPGGIGASPNSGSSLNADFYYTVPTNAPAGTNTLRAEVSDTYSVAGNAATYGISEISFTVSGTPINAPPNAVFNDGPLSLPAGQSGNWTYSVSDTNGNLASWRMGVEPFTSTSPAWQSITGSLQNGSASMSFLVSGTYTLRLEVQDSLGASAFVERQLTVTPSSSPSINSSSIASAATGATFSYTITATNSPTSYGASGLPPGLSLSGSTIGGVPNQAGVYQSTIYASNGVGTGSATVTFTITSSILTANISMPAVVVPPSSGSLNQNIQFTGFSSLGNLTQYKYTILNPDGTTQSSIGWTPFSTTTTSVWVSSGYYGNQWVSSGYWGQVWNETSYYGQYWVYSGYYQSAWVDGYWWSYYYINGEDPSQDGWRYVWQDGYYYWQWVDTSHYEYGWVYSGYWSDGWIDTSHWVYQWVDTSGYVTSTTVQPVTNGAASTSVAITPSTVLGTYKVTLDVLTATSQTYTVWQTYTVATPPASPTATVATNLLGTGFTANWGGIAGATDYRLDLSTSSSFGTYVAGNQDRDVGTVTTFAVGGLASNTTYFYRMRALGPGGTSGNSNVVQLTTLPIITTQPASQVAVATTTVTFSVVVSPGTAPLTYQWRKGAGNLVNGGNVSGATSANLVLTGVLATDAGSYSVVVTNNATGSVTSNAATLTIGVIDLQVHRPQ